LGKERSVLLGIPVLFQKSVMNGRRERPKPKGETANHRYHVCEKKRRLFGVTV